MKKNLGTIDLDLTCTEEFGLFLDSSSRTKMEVGKKC